MIKGILLDYDGVMTKGEETSPSPSEQLTEILNLSQEKAGHLFTSFWFDYLRGKITDKQLWEFLEEKTGRSVPIKQRNIWKKWRQLRPLLEMINFVADLRTNGYTVGLLTNVTPTTEQEVRMNGGYEGFDFCIKSCEVGYAKPDPEIYALALQKFNNLKPEEIIFIDDSERLLIPAHTLGMHTILSTNSRQVIKDVRKLIHKLHRQQGL